MESFLSEYGLATDEGVALMSLAQALLRVGVRAEMLRVTADLYEANRPELFALLASEAGKTWSDAVAEVREAVDFLRYCAIEAETGQIGSPRGPFVAISPWNFPLAIFTGQIAAALVAGNPVVAKPASQTPLIAFPAIELMHEAGIPRSAAQLLPGSGDVGTALTGNPLIEGVVFTGSLPTARKIDRVMASNLFPTAPVPARGCVKTPDYSMIWHCFGGAKWDVLSRLLTVTRRAFCRPVLRTMWMRTTRSA